MKIEQIRKYANVTFEEAMAALDEAEGDTVNAIILLEKQGKLYGKEESRTSQKNAGSAEQIHFDDAMWEKAEQVGGERTESADGEPDHEARHSGNNHSSGKTIGNAVRKVWNILRSNSLHVTHKDKTLVVMPAWLFAILLVFFWHVMAVAIVISLFFSVRYSFSGKDDLSKVNDYLDKAGEIADEIKVEFQ